MSTLNDNYKRILTEIEQKVTNKEELEFVKEKIEELSVMFLNVIDELSIKTEDRIKHIEQKQNIIEQKVSSVAKAVDEIENDIYDEEDEDENSEDGFEFEIVCPYCNNEFVEELNDNDSMKNEIECPECHNIIELDWNDEEEDKGCTAGGCSTCGGCNVDKKIYKEDENKQESDEDDDM